MAPETAAGLIRRRSESSAEVSAPESWTSRQTKTRAAIRCMPASAISAAKRSTNSATSG